MQPPSPRNSIWVQHSAQKLWTSSTIVPQPAQRAGKAKSIDALRHCSKETGSIHSALVARYVTRRTSAPVTTPLFDQQLLAMRRRRALREGADLFLHERALEDIVERLSLVRRRFRSALLIGWPGSWWPETIRDLGEKVRVIEPEAITQLEPATHDLCIAVGGLDTVDDLRRALLTIRFALEEDSLFLGAIPGGDTLPRLREAMRAADEQMGGASPHVHPRIEPVGLSSLLGDTGFTMPVVDVDRVQASYEALWGLVRDLRRMAATNVLASRSRRHLSRAAVEAAAKRIRVGRGRRANDARCSRSFISRPGHRQRLRMDEERLTSAPHQLLTRRSVIGPVDVDQRRVAWTLSEVICAGCSPTRREQRRSNTD